MVRGTLPTHQPSPLVASTREVVQLKDIPSTDWIVIVKEVLLRAGIQTVAEQGFVQRFTVRHAKALLQHKLSSAITASHYSRHVTPALAEFGGNIERGPRRTVCSACGRI